jgi:hypothetical protein
MIIDDEWEYWEIKNDSINNIEKFVTIENRLLLIMNDLVIDVYIFYILFFIFCFLYFVLF